MKAARGDPGRGRDGPAGRCTAKRLGTVIQASDVRPSVKEQVESLGAKFIDMPCETAEEKEAADGVGSYARPMSESWLARQRAEIAKRVALADVVISTALIPGRPAPKLVSAEMVQSMKPGSVIVDLAAANGGNCALTVRGQAALQHGVTWGVAGPPHTRLGRRHARHGLNEPAAWISRSFPGGRGTCLLKPGWTNPAGFQRFSCGRSRRDTGCRTAAVPCRCDFNPA
jgi:hypothetical protein